MITFSASEIGGCSRALVAQYLDYEPIARVPGDEERLQYYSSLEQVAADQIEALGICLLKSEGFCPDCKKERGIERYGFHIELREPKFRIVGHLDRRSVLKDGSVVPVEIKSLGRFQWPKFKKSQFKEFPNYAGQECCYLEHEDGPGLYWVLNRDTGERLKYIVEPGALPGFMLNGFEVINLPVNIFDIYDNLERLTYHIENKTLPGPDSTDCRYCPYRYLCDIGEKGDKAVEDADLVALADSYAELYSSKKLAEWELEVIKQAFLYYSKKEGLNKFTCSKLSVSYGGQKTKRVVDEKMLKQLVSDDILNQVYRDSNPWEDIRIRVLGDK